MTKLIPSFEDIVLFLDLANPCFQEASISHDAKGQPVVAV